ncbi:MAG: hypothetical protein GX907_01380 [Clostridiaceae bacterium]|nr:hypothetical protein [Clostridiaceae bacterium]
MSEITAQHVPIPASRDPFINAHLVPAGTDPETGAERFWHSTWNSQSGCLAVLLEASGRNRIYRFDWRQGHFGFYGASYAEDDILWLCGFLDEIVRLDLGSGEVRSFPTGMSHSLVSGGGLTYDPPTGLLYGQAYCQESFGLQAFVFDTRSEQVVRTMPKLPTSSNYTRSNIMLADGRHLFVVGTPGMDIFTWDPCDNAIELLYSNDGMDDDGLWWSRLFRREEDGALYLHGHGWFRPDLKAFVPGPEPACAATWFGGADGCAYGATADDGNSVLWRWDLAKNTCERLLSLPDAPIYSLRMTRDGKIVSLNLYGFFTRLDPRNRAIENTVRLDSDAIGAVDCLYRIDRNRLLATPFISQRFTEVRLDTGETADMGRATGGVGEVLQVAGLDGLIYMASYTQGQLVAYDPARAARFPENPRVVVHPPESMRPLSMCVANGSIYYVCSHHYGHLGGTLIRYNPSAGEARFNTDAVPNQAICSIVATDSGRFLLGGTNVHADCRSCPPKPGLCQIVRIDADSLQVVASVRPEFAPQSGSQIGNMSGGTADDTVGEADDTVGETANGAADDTADGKAAWIHAAIIGQLTPGQWLTRFLDDEGRWLFATLDESSLILQPLNLNSVGELKVQNAHGIRGTGRTGRFLIERDGWLEVWALPEGRLIRRICPRPKDARIFTQDDDLYVVLRAEIAVYDGAQKC